MKSFLRKTRPYMAFVFALAATLYIIVSYCTSLVHVSFINSALSVNRVLAIAFIWLVVILAFILRRWRQKLSNNCTLKTDAGHSPPHADTPELLLQAQKMETIGRITDGIAHDFNNLLAVIVGNLDILEERIGADEYLRQFLEPSIQAALHGSELTNRLLGFSRKRTFQPKNLSLNKEVTSFFTWLKYILSERIEIAVSLEPNLPDVFADQTQVQNILLALSIYAKDLMPDGGKIIYKTENAMVDAAYAKQHTGVVAGDYAMVAINGIPKGKILEGVAPLSLSILEETDIDRGFGLGIIREFIRKNNGHLTIHSEPDHGISIKIYLPRPDPKN